MMGGGGTPNAVIIVAALTLCASFIRPAPQIVSRPPLATLSAIVGADSAVVMRPAMSGLLPASLGAARVRLAERLQDARPVARAGKLLFGAGCEAHACDFEQAAWALDPGTGSMVAAIMTEVWDPGVSLRHREFAFYGASRRALPAPLARWAAARGLS